MSWDAYVTSLVDGSSGQITKAVIIGLDGGIWTSTAGDKALNVSPAEAAAIAAVMKLKNGPEIQKRFQETGMSCDNQKYMYIRDLYDDGRVILGKKAGYGSITLQCTNLAVVIAFTPNDKEQRAATSCVNGVANYLIQANY